MSDFSDFNLSSINITVVGLGLIGGSIAKSIKKNIKIKNLYAIDVNEDILIKAETEGVINKGFSNPVYPLQNSDVVIFCTYFKTTINFIKEYMQYFKQNSVLTDTTGIKSPVISEIDDILRNDLIFIGGHPMAGKETSGYEFSDDKIFLNANYILTPFENTSENAVSLIINIINSMGFKNISIMSPEQHDQTIAFTSQLPHIIASCLMNNNKAINSYKCMGGAFKDMTRVADLNENMWCELIIENKENIIKEIDCFVNDLKYIQNLIAENQTEKLKSVFIESSNRKKLTN